jgi:hypothetical protein
MDNSCQGYALNTVPSRTWKEHPNVKVHRTQKEATMKHKLTEAIVKKLSAPTDTSSRIFYDSEIRGFGCRVTANIMRNYLCRCV